MTVYTQLANNGPQTAEQLDIVSSVPYTARQNGVSKFNPSSRSAGKTLKSGMNKHTVYYIDGKHKPRTVVQKWLAVNQNVLSDIPNKALHHRIAAYGQEWKEASRDLLDNLGPDHDNRPGTTGGTCPLCQSEYDTHLPDHLPCDGVEE